MPRKHSSGSDDIPLDSYKARSTLYKPDSLPCEFCNHISSSIYANYKHNATHIIIPLVNLTLHQCEDCLHHFTSLEELTAHTQITKHRTSQVTLNPHYDIILQSIIKKQLVIKCHDLFNDIKQNSAISQNDRTEASKEITIENDSKVSKETNIENVSEETNTENASTVSKTKIILDNVTVKSELPTYVISDSDSNGRSTPLCVKVGQSLKKDQSHMKIEAEPKPENITCSVPETITENVPEVTGVPSLALCTEDRSETLLHGKWHDPSDGDSHSDIDDIIEDSKMKFYHSDEEIREVDQSVFKYTTDGNSSPNRKSSTDHEPIRSRLVFEDDLDDDLAEVILPDILCKSTPNMCLLGTTPSTNFNPNSIILGSQTNSITGKNKFFGNGGTAYVNNLKVSDEGEEIVLEEYPETVPYEALVENQICDCKYCGRCFCNRLQLISHETTHMRIRKPRPSLCPYCERFYAGNFRTLRKHLAEKHPKIDPDEKRPQTHFCKICNLSYYNFTRHSQFYHKQEKEEDQLVFRKYRYRTLKVCDMCLNWCKNDHIYKLLGTHSEIGRTQKCFKCKNRHFTINLVTRRRFGYHKDDVNKGMTNEDRLKRIKNKLKMIKRLNKCFCACFILKGSGVYFEKRRKLTDYVNRSKRTTSPLSCFGRVTNRYHSFRNTKAFRITLKSILARSQAFEITVSATTMSRVTSLHAPFCDITDHPTN